MIRPLCADCGAAPAELSTTGRAYKKRCERCQTRAENLLRSTKKRAKRRREKMRLSVTSALLGATLGLGLLGGPAEAQYFTGYAGRTYWQPFWRDYVARGGRVGYRAGYGGGYGRHVAPEGRPYGAGMVYRAPGGYYGPAGGYDWRATGGDRALTGGRPYWGGEW